MPTTWRIQTTGLREVQQRYALAGQHLGAAVLQAVNTRLTEAVTHAKERYLTGGTTSDRLAVRTGRLRDAFAYEVVSTSRPMTWRLGYVNNPPVYAGVQEYGGTLRPTQHQYLTVPLAAALTAAGVPRGRARDFPNTFVARSRRGALIIFQRQGKAIVPLFVLKTSVTIPARPALAPTIAKFLPLLVADIRQAAIHAVNG